MIMSFIEIMRSTSKKGIAWILDQFRFNVVFTKPIFFMLALIFSYSLVDKAVVGVLITHLTELWDTANLPKAAAIVNLSEGTSAVLTIVFAFVADAYLSRFKMVLGSAIAYIIGLFLCFVAARDEKTLDLRIFYAALMMLTLAQAAIGITLKAFLGDQVVARDNPSTREEKERSERRTSFWWYSLTLFATIIFAVIDVDSFRSLTIASAFVMVVAFLWFLSGTKFYTYITPTGSALTHVLYVIRAAIIKRGEEYPSAWYQLYQNKNNNLVQVEPHVSWLRWLDKAAVMPQENPIRNLCSVEQVKGVKFLLKVLPIWTTFIIFGIVAASGSTFFLEEAYQNTDSYSSIQVLVLIQSLTKFISYFLMDKLKDSQRVMLVRIGVGMICSVFCCVTAAVNAAYWLRLVDEYEQPGEQTSVYRLTPQFVLLGLMEGLSQDGFENFFNSQVSESISSYGPPFREFVMGMGKFSSIILILIFRGWFGEDINSSHLDKYYTLLASFSFANLLVYCYVAYWYGDDQFFEGEIDIEMAGLDVRRSYSDNGRYDDSRASASRPPRKTQSFDGPYLRKHSLSSEEDNVALLRAITED